MKNGPICKSLQQFYYQSHASGGLTVFEHIKLIELSEECRGEDILFNSDNKPNPTSTKIQKGLHVSKNRVDKNYIKSQLKHQKIIWRLNPLLDLFL